MQNPTYRLQLENVSDYTMASIMAGDLYLTDKSGQRTRLSKMAMENYQFIENGSKVLFPVLTNRQREGVNDWCVQLGLADLSTGDIVYFDKYFKNNGERIIYENNLVSVVNEHNEFAETDSLMVTETPIERTGKFKRLSGKKKNLEHLKDSEGHDH